MTKGERLKSRRLQARQNVGMVGEGSELGLGLVKIKLDEKAHAGRQAFTFLWYPVSSAFSWWRCKPTCTEKLRQARVNGVQVSAHRGRRGRGKGG